MKSRIKHLVSSIVAALLLLSGPGCRDLAPDGAYKGDQVLFNADLTITTTYTVLHEFVTWEKANRKALRQWPDIKEYADDIRANSKAWFASANAARDAYKLNPDAANKTALELSMSLLRTGLQEAARHMAIAASGSKP